MKVIDLAADYEVANADVRISVDVGDAQIGSTVVKLGNTEKGRGDISNLLIGKGSKIKGKAIKLKSVVTDVNDRTNKTSITYRLKGGHRDERYRSSGTVEDNGDSIIYRARFSLV